MSSKVITSKLSFKGDNSSSKKKKEKRKISDVEVF